MPTRSSSRCPPTLERVVSGEHAREARLPARPGQQRDQRLGRVAPLLRALGDPAADVDRAGVVGRSHEAGVADHRVVLAADDLVGAERPERPPVRGGRRGQLGVQQCRAHRISGGPEMSVVVDARGEVASSLRLEQDERLSRLVFSVCGILVTTITAPRPRVRESIIAGTVSWGDPSATPLSPSRRRPDPGRTSVEQPGRRPAAAIRPLIVQGERSQTRMGEAWGMG